MAPRGLCAAAAAWVLVAILVIAQDDGNRSLLQTQATKRRLSSASPSDEYAGSEEFPFMAEMVRDEVASILAADGGAAEENEQQDMVRRGMEELDRIVAAGGDEALRFRRGLEKMARQGRDVSLGADAHAAAAYEVAPRVAGAGGIAGLYTFGAPGTAGIPLQNARDPSGVFPGLRIVMRRTGSFLGFTQWFYDPVVFSTNVVNIFHAYQDVLVVGDPEQPKVEPKLTKAVNLGICRLPKPDFGFWVIGHMISFYYNGIEPFVSPYNENADAMAWFSMNVYPKYQPTPARLAQSAEEKGWRLVARSASEPLHSGEDPILWQSKEVHLFQEITSLKCAIVFTGTDKDTDWITNLNVEKVSYCGFPQVHRGFRDQLRRATQSSEWRSKIAPALPRCSEVFVTGHSLGGALAELLSACVQRAPEEGYSGATDYQYVHWTPGAPSLLPAAVV